MASLTIYLDDKTLKAVESAAIREESSVSGWARKHLSEAAAEKTRLPANYFETIANFKKSDLEAPDEVETPLDDIDIEAP